MFMDNIFEIPTSPENEKSWVIKFRYNDKNFEIENKMHNSSFASIEIRDNDQFEEGEITGNYVQNENTSEVIFQVSEVGNKGVQGAEEGPPIFSSGHVKYLIAESIVQIILSGKVDRWVSSEGTNSGSDRMYMHIEEDGRVKVETVVNKENGQHHFETTRKNPKGTEKV